MKSTNPLLHTPLILQSAIWPFTRPLLRFFLHLRIEGFEHLQPLSGGIIFVSNHSSELDPVMLPASLPFFSRFMPTFYVSRPRSFYKRSGWRKLFYGGIIFRIWGAHPALAGSHDYSLSLRNHIGILEHGKSLLIFPEGRKTRDGRVMAEEARGGAAYLAEKTGYPIVPIAISGLFNMNLGDFLLRRRRVKVIFGRPLFPTELFSPGFCQKGENQYKSIMAAVLEGIALTNGGSLTYPEFVPIAPRSGISIKK